MLVVISCLPLSAGPLVVTPHTSSTHVRNDSKGGLSTCHRSTHSMDPTLLGSALLSRAVPLLPPATPPAGSLSLSCTSGLGSGRGLPECGLPGDILSRTDPRRQMPKMWSNIATGLAGRKCYRLLTVPASSSRSPHCLSTAPPCL